MKLKRGFITHETDGEYVIVSAGNTKFNGMVRCNHTAGFVVECLKKDTTEAEIVEAMKKQYEATDEQIIDAVAQVLDQLRQIGALDE